MSQRPRPRSGRRQLPRRQQYPAGPYPRDDLAADPWAESRDQAPWDDEYEESFADDEYEDYDDHVEYDDDVEYEEPRYRVISPARVLLALVVIGGGAVAFFGIVIEPQLAMAVSGLGVMGLALGFLAFSLAGAAAALGRRGFGGRALAAAFIGGLCALAGAGALAAAIVLGLLAASA